VLTPATIAAHYGAGGYTASGGDHYLNSDSCPVASFCMAVGGYALARRFTARVGETPAAYLTRWRMDLAAQRLRDTDDTVGAIARALGYTSEYAFNRAFTRHRHTPPGRYRTQARTAQAP
jgi:methylphosphotriester-DNA--protein-cysteine methyltransferase